MDTAAIGWFVREAVRQGVHSIGEIDNTEHMLVLVFSQRNTFVEYDSIKHPHEPVKTRNDVRITDASCSSNSYTPIAEARIRSAKFRSGEPTFRLFRASTQRGYKKDSRDVSEHLTIYLTPSTKPKKSSGFYSGGCSISRGIRSDLDSGKSHVTPWNWALCLSRVPSACFQ